MVFNSLLCAQWKKAVYNHRLLKWKLITRAKYSSMEFVGQISFHHLLAYAGIFDCFWDVLTEKYSWTTLVLKG